MNCQDSQYTNDVEKIAVEKHLANKYLDGELTFAEYTEKWFGSGATDEDESEYVDNEGEEDVEERTDGIEIEESVSSKTVNESGKRIKRRVRRQLPTALAGLMGEANLRYARGDHETAERMCYEIIRQHPTGYEPFQTLAQIYESNPEKSLEFSLIAAHLNSDPNEWIRLAEILKEKGDVKQELICLTRAIKANPKNISNHILRLERLQYLEKNKLLPSGNINVMLCRTALMNSYPDTEGETVLAMAKNIARDYHAANKIHLASNVMHRAYKRFSDLFTYEDLNLYIELLITQNQFDKCIEIFIAKGDVEVEAELERSVVENEEMQNLKIVNCNIPLSLPIDLRTKLIICLIHLKAFHIVNTYLATMIENEDVETTGDIFLDIEEALTSEGLHSESLKLLTLLVQSNNFSLPAVWLKYAECLTALGMNDKAIEAFQVVVDKAPQHLNARIKLSALLKESNRIDEAYIALKQDETTDVLDTAMLYERCLILKNIGDKMEYLKAAHLLLSRHFVSIRHKSEVFALLIKDTHENLMALRDARGEPFDDPNALVFDENCDKLTLKVEWDLLMDVLNTAFELNEFATLQRISFLALASKRFVQYRKKLEFLSLLASYYNNDSFFALRLVKIFVVKMSNNIGVWNLFCLILQKTEDARSFKFLNRLLAKLDNYDKDIHMLIGNYQLKGGSYKCAIKEYRNCFNRKPTALNALLCGIVMIHVATHKFSLNRNTLVAQATAYLKYYEELRGKDGLQEIYYNMGRAYHQINLVNIAAEYYKRGLEISNELIESQPEIFDLRRELAYNLHLIYKDNCPDLAKMYLYKYIIL